MTMSTVLKPHFGTSSSMTPSELRLVINRNELYSKIMPIDPDYDPALCRDEFLRQLFSELRLPEIEQTSSSEDSLCSLQDRVSKEVSLKEVLLYGLQSTRSTLNLDQVSIKGIEARMFRLNVLTGREDKYDELLESMSRSSLFFMFSRVINKLRIMQSFSLQWVKMDIDNLPHMLFKWSMDGLFTRCMLPDTVYLDVLMLNHSPDELNWAKFSRDLLEILRYYKYFYTQVYLNEGYGEVNSMLRNQEHMLGISEELDKNLRITKETFKNIDANSSLAFGKLSVQYQSKLVSNCQRRSMAATVRLPIEWRYIRDYYATLVDMENRKNNLPIDKLKKQIFELTDALNKHSKTSAATSYAYQHIIQDYQKRINEFSNKLSTDLENWENEVTLKTMRLNKAKDDFKEKVEKIKHMRQRVKEVQELIEAEQQALMERLLANVHVTQGKSRKRSSSLRQRKTIKSKSKQLPRVQKKR